MAIQSAFNSGVQGFNRAQEAASESALAISRASLNASEAQPTSFDLQETNSITAPVNPPVNAVDTQNAANNQAQLPESQSNDIVDLNEELVDLKVAEFQAAASTNVIRTADEVLGTLIDVTA